MKVLQIINSLSTGGAEKLVVDSTPLYQKEGITVDVLTLKNTKTDFWKLLANVSNGKIRGLTSGSIYNPLLIFRIIPYLKKYDIIHAHLFPVLYWVVIAKYISFSNVKIIYTEHNTDNKRRHNPLLKILDKKIYNFLHQIVSISAEVELNLKKHLCIGQSNKFSQIGNGVNLSVFKKAIAYSKSDFFTNDSFILIQISSFRQQKDQATLIKSLEYLPENIKLLLVGDGPLKSQNSDLVKTLGLEQRVKFLGLRSDIPQLLQTADVAVLSSNYEGLSLSSIEGMACKPFVASDVPGLTEVVFNYGLLFEKGNAVQLSEKIYSLYSDNSFYKTIASQCLLRACQFDIKSMIKSYLVIYKKLIF